MTQKKGKKGEMLALTIASSFSDTHISAEVMRHSKTTAPDLGADLFITADKEPMKEFLDNAGNPGSFQNSELKNKLDNDSLKARIDCKNTEEKLTKATVQKHISEIAIHQDSDLHILMGGSGLTKGAKQCLEDANNALASKGKEVVHINNKGIRRLYQAYPPIRPDPETNVGIDSTDGDE